MIIGVDYTAAVWQGAGIGRYTRELMRSAVALGGPFQYVLFYAAGGLPPDSPYLADMHKLCADFAHVRAVALNMSPRLLTIVWQRLRLPLSVEWFTGPLDVLHAPDFVLPPTRARTLLTIHDLTFLVYPNCFEPSLARYLRRAVPRHLRRANLVLADSQATRNDLIRLLKVPPERIVVVYPGVREQFRPLPSVSTEAVRQRLELPHEFLLFVGTLEPRKNIVCLLQAYHQMLTMGSAKLPQLVIAGRKGWLYQDIFATVERLGLQSHIIFLDFVADEDLPALYSMARVFVYPSLYEGFGLPVVEALACGTPVVTTSVASLPEVAGNAAIMVNPLERDAIADGIQQALERAHELRTAGPGAARRFTWEQSGRALLACYLAARDGGA